MIKNDVGRMMEEFHFHGVILRGCNSSIITLVSKVGDPIGLNEYRHISLVDCFTCLYKIISKVLARRLKLVMNDIIKEN